jgi:hypothetical protein
MTRPLEEAILRSRNPARLSKTTRGSVEISAEFSWGTDMRTPCSASRRRSLDTPDLPTESRIDAEWMNTAIFLILATR